VAGQGQAENAQSTRGIIHSRQRSPLLDGEIMHPDDLWMSEARQDLCFGEQCRAVLPIERGMERFDRRDALEQERLT